MKIIVRKKNEIVCYVQLRDLVYLASGKRNSFRELSCKYIKEGKIMTDFVRVSDKAMIDIIENLEDIVDLNDYRSYSIESLSHLLVSKNLFCDPSSSRRVDHQTQAIQDIISYKKGELGYTIPLVVDDRFVQNINGYVAMSTSCDNKFIVKCENGVNDDFEIAIDILKKLALDNNLLKGDVEYSYRVVEVDGYQVITFVQTEKKKKNVFQKLFNKKRTEN